MSCTVDFHGVASIPGQSLWVVQCGITVCGRSHSCGPVAYPNYAIHFLLKGKCTYVVGDMAYSLSRGQGFLMNPFQENTYTADEEDPCTFIYMIFGGNDADAIVRNAGLNENDVVFSFSPDEDFIQTLYSVHAACKNVNAMGYDAVGYFMLAMSRLIAANASHRSGLCSAEQYLSKAILYMEHHYPYKLSISEMAKHVGLERSYLYRLFMNRYGQSPSEYLNDFRLKKAIGLMNNPGLSLNSIALSTGFYDFSYFFRQFYKKYRITPGAYRKKHRSGPPPERNGFPADRHQKTDGR